MERITNTMKEIGMTGRALCKELGITETNFTQWKKGKEGYRRHLPRIAGVLGVSVDYLVTGNESPAEELYRKYRNTAPNIRLAINDLLEIKTEEA